MGGNTKLVDLSFPVVGRRAPQDHGYPLYSALCRALPVIHDADWLAVHPLKGSATGDGMLHLSKTSELRLRLPIERIGDVLPLAGRELELAGERIGLGVPRVFALTPAPSLDARIVVIKITGIPKRRNDTLGRDALDVQAIAERVNSELARQMRAMGVNGTLELCGRQHITIAGRRILGYSVRVGELSADHSLMLQACGLGGKRTMGCGVFRPTRGRTRAG